MDFALALLLLALAAPSPATTLCAIGDSLSTPDGWASRLPADWTVTALGIPGTAAQNWWQQHRSQIDGCTGADVVTVTLGSNDRAIGYSADGFVAWLGLVTGYVAARYPAVLLWQVVPYLDVTAALCVEQGMTCLDQSALLDPGDYRDPTKGFFASWEGVHPNSRGQQIMADAVVRVVPEPSTLMMMGAAVAALSMRRRIK